MSNRKSMEFKEAYSTKNVTVSPKAIQQKEYKKLLDEVTELLYDYFCQRQKNRSRLSNELGEPQQEVA